MPETSLLPPIKAVRIVWALTGEFAKDSRSRLSASLVEKEVENIRSSANENNEKKYVSYAVAAMYASLRTIHTIYKGRDLNFVENERLRLASLKSVEESIEFGTKLKDVLKSLPGMTIGGVSGATVGQRLEAQYQSLGISPPSGTPPPSVLSALLDTFSESGILLWTMVALGIVIGFLLNWLFLAWIGRRKQRLYFMQDYERNLYYHQYLRQVRGILESLYLDLDQVHEKIFGDLYPINERNKIIEEILSEAEPRHCKYVDRHMREKKITPELWPLCETGNLENLEMKAVEECPHWKAEEDWIEMTANQKLWYDIRRLWMRIW